MESDDNRSRSALFFVVGAPASLFIDSNMKLALRYLLAAALLFASSQAVKVGDVIGKDLEFHFGFPPETINLKDRLANKKVILLGLPGAFTPT